MIADYPLFHGLWIADSATSALRSVKREVSRSIGWLGSCLSVTHDPRRTEARTRTFAIEIIKLARSLPSDFVTAHIARQLVRSGTSVGANYRSSCRAKSEADFISKMSTVEEEADETGYWLELLVETMPSRRRRWPRHQRSGAAGPDRRGVDQDGERPKPLIRQSAIPIRNLNPQSAIRDPQYGGASRSRAGSRPRPGSAGTDSRRAATGTRRRRPTIAPSRLAPKSSRRRRRLLEARAEQQAGAEDRAEDQQRRRTATRRPGCRR